MLLGKGVEGDHALPVAFEGGYRLRIPVAVAAGKRGTSFLGLLARLGRRDLRQQRPRLSLNPLRQVIEHVEDLVVPAALVRRLRPHLFGGAPDREAPVGHQQQRGPQTPIAQVAQDLQPGLRRLAVAGPHGQYLFAAITHGADDDQQGRLVLLQPGLDVDAIRPRVHQFGGRRDVALARSPAPPPTAPAAGQWTKPRGERRCPKAPAKPVRSHPETARAGRARATSGSPRGYGA